MPTDEVAYLFALLAGLVQMKGASLRPDGQGAEIAADVNQPVFIEADEKIGGEKTGDLVSKFRKEREDRTVAPIGAFQKAEKLRRLVEGLERRTGHPENRLPPGQDLRADLLAEGLEV